MDLGSSKIIISFTSKGFEHWKQMRRVIKLQNILSMCISDVSFRRIFLRCSSSKKLAERFSAKLRNSYASIVGVRHEFLRRRNKIKNRWMCLTTALWVVSYGMLSRLKYKIIRENGCEGWHHRARLTQNTFNDASTWSWPYKPRKYIHIHIDRRS